MKAKVRTSTSTAIDFNGTVFKVWYFTQEYADTMTCRFCSGLSEIGDVGCKCVSRSLKSDVVCDRVHCTDLGVNENYKNDREQTGSNVRSETNSRFVFISWQPGNVLKMKTLATMGLFSIHFILWSSLPSCRKQQHRT